MDPDQCSTIVASDEDLGDAAPGPLTPELLEAAERHELGAAELLFSALYGELSRMAQRELARRQGVDGTIGVRSLLHEAYLVIRERTSATFIDHGRFMAYAARVMRGLIIDHSRHRRAQKRGGQFFITSLDSDIVASPSGDDLSSINDALTDLADLDPELAEIVDLKFFCGFSFAEIAAMRRVSERTVQRNWEKARLLLHRTMRTAALD